MCDFAFVREVEWRMCVCVGFGWVCWGDVEMILSVRDGLLM